VAFSALIRRLPKPNLSLLRALSQYLIVIINNSDVNKMTVRNVGIVFAPTLNIPAPVFSMFLTDYDQIFGDELSDAGTKTVEITVDKPMTPDDIRSPRHQMFSDIPTPAYNQTSFQGMDNPAQGSHQDIRSAYDTGFIPMQPSYQQQPLGSDPNQRLGDPSQMNAMRGLPPSNLNQSKSKRRESSMLFMGMGNRKSSVPKPRDDQCKWKCSS
jgi:RalA-binding protein 1